MKKTKEVAQWGSEHDLISHKAMFANQRKLTGGTRGKWRQTRSID